MQRSRVAARGASGIGRHRGPATHRCGPVPCRRAGVDRTWPRADTRGDDEGDGERDAGRGGQVRRGPGLPQRAGVVAGPARARDAHAHPRRRRTGAAAGHDVAAAARRAGRLGGRQPDRRQRVVLRGSPLRQPYIAVAVPAVVVARHLHEAHRALLRPFRHPRAVGGQVHSRSVDGIGAAGRRHAGATAVFPALRRARRHAVGRAGAGVGRGVLAAGRNGDRHAVATGRRRRRAGRDRAGGLCRVALVASTQPAEVAGRRAHRTVGPECADAVGKCPGAVRHPCARLPRGGSLHHPGAIFADERRLDGILAGYPRDGKVVIYCACPDEVSAAWMAGKLRAAGFHDVLPLRGGIDAWRAGGFGVDPLAR